MNPVRTFLQHGVGVRIPRQREERSDLVATKPDPLGAWGLASRLFELVLASELPVDDIEQQWRRLAAADGDLPPGRFAERAAASTRERIAALTEGLATSGLPLRAAGIEAIDLRLPSGRTLTDRVTDVHGTTVVLARPGRLRPKELLDAHVRVLALRAAGIDADGIIAGTTTKQPYDSVRVDHRCRRSNRGGRPRRTRRARPPLPVGRDADRRSTLRRRGRRARSERFPTQPGRKTSGTRRRSSSSDI